MMDNYNQYFNRQIQLWGLKTQKALQDRKIAIIGCGGLGCSLGIALSGSGVGQIDLVDFDTIEIHNIHRQIAFKTEDIDKNKADILQKYILERNPFLKSDSFIVDFESFTQKSKIKYDLILDATDNLEVRVKIDEFAKKNKIPWIYGSVEEFNGQVCFFKDALFESIFNISKHQVKGITAPIVMNIASAQANLAIRYLANLPIKEDYLYYYFCNKEGEFISQQFGLPTN